jgi:quinol monooxygenase YgiN
VTEVLRLFRGRADVERADEVAAALHGESLAAARTVPGLVSYAGGLRTDADAVRFVIVSTWDTPADLARQTSPTFDRAARPLAGYMLAERIDHYELVTEPAAVIVAAPEAIVRVATMEILHGSEDLFYSAVRRGLEDPTASGDLLAYYLGRRGSNRHDVAAVSVWRSAAALGKVVRPETGEPLWADLRPLIEDFEVEHYDAGPRPAAEDEAPR